jgi:site-specific DNA-methyltransferase (adenine-specific)
MINITNEDNMQLMARYPDDHFDLAIVDPPYGININVSMGRRKGDKKSNYHKFAGNDSSIPSSEYFNELKRVSKNQIVWGGNYMTEHLKPSSCWLMWDKKFSEEVTFAQFEMAWTSFKSSAKKYDKHPNQLNRIHPTQKPVEIYEWQLMKYAKKGDKILDTHGGSLSIALAVHNVNSKESMNLTLNVCELDKEYFDTGVKRYKNHTQQKTIFDL